MHNRLEEYEDEENHLIDSILASPLDFGRLFDRKGRQRAVTSRWRYPVNYLLTTN